MPVSAAQEVTLAYMFRPDAMLEPRDFGLLVNVYYKDGSGKNYTSTAFNGTVDLLEPVVGWDAQRYVGALSTLLLASPFPSPPQSRATSVLEAWRSCLLLAASSLCSPCSDSSVLVVSSPTARSAPGPR
jgi:hypothetical protein